MTKEWHSLHRRRVTVTGEGARRRARAGGRAGHRVPAALGAQPRRPASPTNGLLPARGRRRLGRLEPVRPAARADDRARRAAGPGRRHRGRRRVRRPTSRSTARTRRRGSSRRRCRGCGTGRRTASGCSPWTWRATRCRRCRPVAGARSRPTVPPSTTPARTSSGCDRATRERDLAGVAAARREAVIEHLRTPERGRCPAARRAAAPATRASTRRSPVWSPRRPREQPVETAAQRAFDDVAAASRILAESRETLARAAAAADRPRRVRPAHPQRRPPASRRAAATGPGRPSPPRARTCGGSRSRRRRSSPATSSARVSSPPHLVVRSGIPGRHRSRHAADAERHVAPPKATQLEAETAGRFDTAIGTGDAAEIQRLYAVALAERGTLLDQFVPSLTDPPRPRRAARDRPRRPARSGHRLGAPGDAGGDHGRPRPADRRGPVRHPRHRRTAAAVPAGPVRHRVSRWCSTRRARRTCCRSRVRCRPSPCRTRARGRLQPLRLVVERGERARRPSRRTRGPRDRCRRGSRCGWRSRAPWTRARSTTSGCGARTWRASSTPPTATPPTRSSPPRP